MKMKRNNENEWRRRKKICWIEAIIIMKERSNEKYERKRI